jgi:hypothetical protein
MLIDFWRKGVHYQRGLFVAALVLAIIGFIPMAYFVLVPAFTPVVYWFFHLSVAQR